MVIGRSDYPDGSIQYRPARRSSRELTVTNGLQEVDIVILGGCGHVGLPLALAFADRGLHACSFDLNEGAVKTVSEGDLPFREVGAQEVLHRCLDEGRFSATSDPSIVSRADTIVVVIGTPVDEHLNPDPHAVPASLEDCAEYLRDGQLLVLRSTLYPGVTRRVESLLHKRSLDIDVAFCPERIAEGQAMEELFTLPQIVAARTPQVRQRARALFAHLTQSIVELEPEEAELAKLFTNAWRYIKFAAANQFFIIANDHGLDFEKIRAAIVHEYPRAGDIPGAGFAAGPCLLKDTMQLAAFTDNAFVLGHTAMLVNEGLPLYLVSQLEATHDLSEMAVGILGMAFKGESDDIRSSLAYKLKRILEFKACSVSTTDPYVTVDPDLQPLQSVVDKSDLLIIGAPHKEYALLETDKPIVDIWNLRARGSRA